MTGHVADLSWKIGARAIEKLDRLRSTLAVNVLTSLYWKCVAAGIFSPPRAIFREHNWYISTARSTKWVTRCKIHLCEHHV